MTAHVCRTGFHERPTASCYSHHGCRCDGCRAEKSGADRRVVASDDTDELDRRARHMQVTVPTDPWLKIVRAAERNNITIGELLHDIARQVRP